MPIERPIRRFTAFFKGWAQAFGNHRGGFDEEQELNWLFGEDDDQIGLILQPRVKRLLYREVLTHQTRTTLTLRQDRIGIDRVSVPTGFRDEQAVRMIRALLEDERDLYLYQTYHLFYPSGTRILTLSRKTPLAIIYKEMAPLQVTVV